MSPNRYVSITELKEPVSRGLADQTFISKSYDSTSHFVTVYEDIASIYQRVTGNELVLKQRPRNEEEQ